MAASRSKLSQFVQKPDAIIRLYPHGTAEMESDVTDLASASRTVLAPMARLFPKANDEQGEAFGNGLARAARRCQGRDNDLARAISDAALRSGDARVALAFRQNAEPDNDPAGGGSSGNDPNGHSTVQGVSMDKSSMKLSDPFAPVGIKGE